MPLEFLSERRLQIVIPLRIGWERIIVYDENRSKELPDFEVHSATKLGEGWMSEVFEINQEWAFGFCKESKRFTGFGKRNPHFTPRSRLLFLSTFPILNISENRITIFILLRIRCFQVFCWRKIRY